ncbi:carbohydrate ABC transporter permease [Leifsonia sp. TF02-11]|uniref:carbohydrate ABC transporter permease n=1 Tax=Leifsonia sp. TF02-11 TaxID=2815212 RepID=UPI001AA1B3BF|nr:carbohydrate ABC transporter permease [Leifsonia sp. TF02-11]MBN9630278.1 carbohydrate ABC transporter permease [Actinomycetota bacterium]MBO1739327.1 carbohydrate ABC transporter permease [Leifsonia sp. TF02-11]
MINRYTGRSLALEITMWAIALLFLLPLVGLVNLSLKAPHNPSGAFEFDGEYSFVNYVRAWNDGHLGAALANSAVIAIVSVVAVLLLASLAAYPLARVGTRWPRWLFYLFLAGLIIPGQLGVLPLYTSMRDLGLVGNIAGVIVASIGGGMPFAIFILTTFLREAPKDFEEASALDGCGPLRTYWYVIVPLLRPALGTVAILSLIAIWNNFFLPLLFLSGSGSETLPVRISGFIRTYSADWPAVFAALVISTAPILACYFSLQKHIIQGFSGGLKG